MSTGSNLPAVAGYNQAVVIDMIRRSPRPVTRSQLARATGLSAQTISNVTRRLLDSKLVQETGTAGFGIGKPGTLLELDPHRGYAVGVHIDPAVITCVLLDLNARVIERATLAGAPGDPELAVDRIAETALGLIRSAHIDPADVLGLGVAAPGPIDAARGVILTPPLMAEWADTSISALVEERSGISSLLVKDATAAAFAERWMEKVAPSSNLAFVYYGTGIGIGLVLGDEVYRGSSQNAGDIGHVLVDTDGPLCSCGRRGCFGGMTRPFALVTEAIDRGVLEASGELTSQRVDELFAELTRLAESDEESEAAKVIDRAITHTARFLINVVNLLDLDRVVFGGPAWAPIAALMLRSLGERMAELGQTEIVHPLQITGAMAGPDIAAVGAGCLVLDQAFTPRSSRLLLAAEGLGLFAV